MTSERSPQYHATRLRVFAAVKRLMHELKRCPTIEEVKLEARMSEHSVREHLASLNGADGLPYAIGTKRARTQAGQYRRSLTYDEIDASYVRGGTRTAIRRGDRIDSNTVPIDELINNYHRIQGGAFDE